MPKCLPRVCNRFCRSFNRTQNMRMTEKPRGVYKNFSGSFNFILKDQNSNCAQKKLRLRDVLICISRTGGKVMWAENCNGFV